MSEQGVQLSVEQDADVTIISILTPRIPVDLSESFEESVMQQVNQLDTPKVLMDFDGVEFISSAILGKLIKLSGKLEEQGGQFKLCSLTERIREVFKVTQLYRHFGLYKTRDKAIKAFK